MKVLYVIQHSIYNKKPKWISADSNINMAVGFITEALKQSSDISFDVLIAPLEDIDDIASYDDLMCDDRVRFIPMKFPIDAFLLRQHFDTKAWERVLKEEYDVIINNIPELSRNIRTILTTKKIRSKLVSQCFWLDCPMIGEAKVDQSCSYDWRQFDGFECSDLVTFTCYSTMEAFCKNSAHRFTIENVDRIMEKSIVCDFGYSQSECDVRGNYSFPTPRRRQYRIVFPNRLSELNYTNHLAFIEALRLLEKNFQGMFEVVFTNPTGKIDLSEFDIPGLVNIHTKKSSLTRDEYWSLLKSSDISVHLFVIERYGGCSLRESIAAGCVPVVANVHEAAKITYTIPNVRVNVNTESATVDPEDIYYAILAAAELVAKEDAGNVEVYNRLELVRRLNYENSSFENTTAILLGEISKMLCPKALTGAIDEEK